MGQVVCKPDHAYGWAIQEREKKTRRLNKEAKKKFKQGERSWWMNANNVGSTAHWFHKFIRERDKHDACISCDTATPLNQYHCGHFRSVGAASQLRFNPLNANRQCSQCNAQKSGNYGPYRKKLVLKIGAAKVEELECSNEIHRWELDELERLRDYWKDQYGQIHRGPRAQKRAPLSR